MLRNLGDMAGLCKPVLDIQLARYFPGALNLKQRYEPNLLYGGDSVRVDADLIAASFFGETMR